MKWNVVLCKLVSFTVQRWAGDNYLASRQRQRYNVIEPQGPEKIHKYLGLGV